VLSAEHHLAAWTNRARRHGAPRLAFLDPVEVSWKVKKWLNVGTERRLKKVIADVHGFAMGIVRARRWRASASVDHTTEFRPVVVHGERQAQRRRGAKPLRDIVLSFLIAGRETTS
jgi:cytochrome P450